MTLACHEVGAARLDEAGDFLLIDLDVVAPGPDDRHVRAHHRAGAVVGAAGELELELVGEFRTVQLVDEFVGEEFRQPQGVVAAHLAAGRADAAAERAHAAAGAADIPALLHQGLAGGMGGLVVGAEQQDVAGHAVELQDAGAVLFADVAEFAQGLGGIHIAGRLDDP